MNFKLIFAKTARTISLLFLIGTSLARAQGPEDGLWEQYPVSSAFQLSTGQKVPVPYRSMAQYISLTGMVDTKKLNEILNSQDLVSVPLNANLEYDPKGASLIAIYVLDYVHSSVGPYRELLISTLAQSTSPLHPPRIGYYCLKIKVDQIPALLLGNEMFGLSKTISKIELDWDTDEMGKITNNLDQVELQLKCKDCKKLGSNLLSQTFSFISPYEKRRTWYEFSNLGQIASRPFNPDSDTFIVGNGTSAELLTHLEFKPLFWMNGKDVRIVVSGGN